MNHLTDINYITSLLKQYGFRPKDYMGQNFLVDDAVLAELVEAAQLKKTDIVVEVGPGLGVLTKELGKRAKKVFAIEKDKTIIPVLKKQIFEATNIEVINEDILSWHLEKEIIGEYKVVANIPYYLTSKLLQHFLTMSNKPKLLVLMIQKEVGERIVADPGKLSILGISVQFYADVELVRVRTSPPFKGEIKRGSTAERYKTSPSPSLKGGEELRINPLIIPKESFWPVPKVDSVILQITTKNKYPKITNEQLFFKILKTAFSGKRKQIHNTLSSGLKIEKEKLLRIFKSINIDPKLRPQDLTIEQWIEIFQKIQ